MSPEIVGLLGVVLLLVLMFARMWIGAAMAAVGFIGFAYLSSMDKAFGIVALTPYNTLSNYTLTAVPMFVLMGTLVAGTGVGTDLYDAAYKWFGHLRGGLAIATVAACALFAAICGMSAAEALTIGKIALPEMKKHGYADSLATACVASAGTLGILIPPSLGFVLYGILTEQSVGFLFMAGILPGVLLSLLYMIAIMIWTMRNPKAGPAGPKTSFREKVISLKLIWTTVALFVLVMGGIYMGLFTPTEGGAVGAFGAIIITLVSRQLTSKNLLSSIVETGLTTSLIVGIIMGAFIFQKFMAVSQLPFGMADFIKELSFSRYIIWAIIIVIYIILGMFLDIMSCMVITVPLIYPVILSLGFDPIWFGVQVVLLMQMGLITPPVGMDVFILSSITDVPLGTIFKGVWPFVGAIMVCIILVTIFPQIALFLPSRM
jgi:tripartite ATP-independent transporter DctM subunit